MPAWLTTWPGIGATRFSSRRRRARFRSLECNALAEAVADLPSDLGRSGTVPAPVDYVSPSHRQGPCARAPTLRPAELAISGNSERFPSLLLELSSASLRVVLA